MEDSVHVTDYFWLNPNRRLYGFYGPGITAGRVDICRSQCIQNKKRCPLYNTCRDKDMIKRGFSLLGG